MTAEQYNKEFGVILLDLGIKNFTPMECAPVGRMAGTVKLQAPPKFLWANAVKTLRVLQDLRDYTGRVITITSGYRDEHYNVAIGGEKNSHHMAFRAFDIQVRGLIPKQVVELLEKHREADRIGIGSYRTFVHVDSRGARARWNG
jgi:uncharacterized protein YcbK (DUF882 family)